MGKKRICILTLIICFFMIFSSDFNSYAKSVRNTRGNAQRVGDYTYEVIPLLSPFNSYFYIKTDNPDPDSFRLIDRVTRYSDTNGSITPDQTKYYDVIYENEKTFRVKGGYIARGSSTDGGEIGFQLGEVTGTTNVYNITTGETTVRKNYKYTDTDAKFMLPELYDVPDYLIATYGDDEKSYFDNLTAIQSGFSSICLYSGVYVLGDLKKSEKVPYYGLSTSPHVDQTFYIQGPYSRTSSKSMLISGLYPCRYDSIGFPSIMSTIAKRLNSAAAVEWSQSAHYLINVTYNGETMSYGGQGYGGGQGIYENQIMYRYKFDGSSGDLYTDINLDSLKAKIKEYGALTVPEEPTDEPKLTFAEVRKTVGEDGAYVKLVLITSIFGGTTDGFTYLYDDGSTSEGSKGFGRIGHFYNAWYDGRYFNKWEYFYPGAEFKDTVEKEKASIIIKDPVIKFPSDGKEYYYNYKKIEEVENYDMATGVWKGFIKFSYNDETKTWVATSILNSSKYRDSGRYNAMDDQAFIDACTITWDEAMAMNIDRNTNKDPEEYYIYDRVTKPGTWHAAPKDKTDPSKDKPGVISKGTSLENAEKTILAIKDEKDPAGSEYGKLKLKIAKTSKNSIKIKWNKVAGAKGYVIFGSKCGKKNQFKKITTSGGNTFVQKKLKKGTYYKYIVVAFDKTEKVVSTSKVVHIATKGGKVGNAGRISTRAKKNKVTLKVKKSFKLKAKEIPANKKQKIKHHRKVQYESSNTKIAVVNKKGVIKAKSKGSCFIYVYAQDGIAKKIKVKVK